MGSSRYTFTHRLRVAIKRTLPPHAFEHVDFDGLFDAIAEECNGHVLQAGWHFGWCWSDDGATLEFLSEHRMTEITADSFAIDPADGTITATAIGTPGSMRLIHDDPGEDARLAAEFTRKNRELYDDLRARRLLPPVGENDPFQDMNELLVTDRVDDVS